MKDANQDRLTALVGTPLCAQHLGENMRWIKRLLLGIAGLLALLWLGGYFLFAQPAHSYLPVTEAQKQEARDYLAKNMEPMPKNWQWDQFEAADGAALEVGFLETPSAKGTIVLVPGYTAPIDVYPYAITRFADAGYNVAAISYRGQGRSPRPLPDPEKGYVEDYGLIANDVNSFVDLAAARFGVPVMVFGNSKGGHIALRMAGDFAPDVRAYGLMVPMVKIYTGSFPYWFASGLSRFYSATGLGTYYAAGQKQWQTTRLAWDEPTACTSRADKARQRDAVFALEEGLRIEGTTFQWVASTVKSTALIESEAYRKKLDKPFLFVTAGKDTIVDTPAASKLCDGVKQCEEAYFDQSMHCIDREDDADRTAIYDAFIAHFDANL